MENKNSNTHQKEELLKLKIENQPQVKNIKTAAFNLFISVKCSPLESILHRKIVQRLYSRYIHKSNLRIYFKENYSELPIIFQHLASILPKPLNININFQNKFNDIQDCRNINKGIKYWYSGRDISLNFSDKNFEGFEYENNQNQYQFFTGIQHLKSVKKLNLDFSFAKIKDLPVIEHVFRSVKQLKQLEEISVQFPYLKINNNDYIQQLGKMLGNLENLYSIYLNFQGIKVTTQDLKNCLDSLNNLKFLIELQFNFYSSYLEQNQIVYLAEKIQQLNLEKIDLTFHGTKMDSQTVNLLCKGLKKMDNLKKLYLDLSHCHVDQEGVSYISEVIQQSTKITNLEIQLYNNNLKDEGLQILCQQISNLTQLECLYLDFSDNPIIHGVKYLGKALKNLKNLDSLVIFFGQTPKISSESIKTFSEGLKHLQKLKDLSIDFTSCNFGSKEITNQCQAISTIKSLNSLQLFFENNQIKDEGFCSCISIFQSLNLIELYLNLSQNNISDNCIDFLESLSIEDSRMSTLDLNLSNNEFSNKFIECLQKYIYPLQNLQQLNINFDNNPYITSNILKYIAAMVTQYPGLQEIDLRIQNIDMEIEDSRIFSDLIKSKSSISKFNLEVAFKNMEEETIQEILNQIEQMNNLEWLLLLTGSSQYLKKKTQDLLENWQKQIKDKLYFSYISVY